jgi:hypothetical protein
MTAIIFIGKFEVCPVYNDNDFRLRSRMVSDDVFESTHQNDFTELARDWVDWVEIRVCVSFPSPIMAVLYSSCAGFVGAFLINQNRNYLRLLKHCYQYRLKPDLLRSHESNPIPNRFVYYTYKHRKQEAN